jgi:hypothetical protein
VQPAVGHGFPPAGGMMRFVEDAQHTKNFFVILHPLAAEN